MKIVEISQIKTVMVFLTPVPNLFLPLQPEWFHKNTNKITSFRHVLREHVKSFMYPVGHSTIFPAPSFQPLLLVLPFPELLRNARLLPAQSFLIHGFHGQNHPICSATRLPRTFKCQLRHCFPGKVSLGRSPHPPPNPMLCPGSGLCLLAAPLPQAAPSENLLSLQ